MPPKRSAKAAKKNTPSPAARKKAGAANARKTKATKKLDDDEDEDDDVDEPPAKIVRQDSQNTQIKKAFETLKTEEKQNKKASLRLDGQSPFGASDQIYEDYTCMLNQTNINANNNKFYVIQLVQVKQPKSYAVFTRWGRVGETGQQMTNQFKSVDDAVKEFKKKFKDKTKNDWDDRENFKPYSKKYTLLEIDEDDDESDSDTNQPQTSKAKIEDAKLICSSKYTKSTLDEQTLEFIQRIFDEEMFNNTMQDFSLDIKKMPLGKLSKTQISKGFDVLVAIEECITKNSDLKELERLSSQFYTLIPHSFGRSRPAVLNSYTVQKKKEMLLVLSDIELTQSLQKEMDANKKTGLQPNPWDEKYKLLHCDLSVLPNSTDEYKIIESYFTVTACDWTNVKLKHVWKVDREHEGNRFANHEDIKERKLLWHGTNIAVVAAILSSGLRIMPHSGGRVGKGIYFASEHSKSFGYTSCDRKGLYVMFLNEVALGKEHTITVDNSSLKAPPAGYDCVVARGSQEPDPKKDTKLSLNGKEVVVPQGKPVKTKFSDSSFNQSEYLVYKESQVRIRYVLAFSCP